MSCEGRRARKGTMVVRTRRLTNRRDSTSGKRKRARRGRALIDLALRSNERASFAFELAEDDFVAAALDAAGGVAGVHDELGGIDDVGVVVAGVVGCNDDAVVAAD